MIVSTILWGALNSPAAYVYVPSTLRPPALQREFRGVWMASVNNIDWPSQRGLTTAQQQAEFRAILDRAVQLNLNAVILQVRPACDALYASSLEPWSEYLTGRMGRAPKPYYDPLAFAIQECHQRGLELHAWFNPYRARHSTGTSPVHRLHVSQSQPQLVRTYGSQQWLDPGDPAVQRHSLAVILDVVRRYQIDGVHLDDYFYPYPEKYANGRIRDFPDDTTWKRYQSAGGKLTRGDWRRSNVDRFVQSLYQAIKAEKPAVQFGISPFGIWRSGYPAQIRGFDAYALLYADARKWFQQGWLDYFAPQLYWAIGAREQSFPVLLDWWASQNLHRRHLWAGMSCYRHSPTELVNQIKATRRQKGASGNILWSAKTLLRDNNGVARQLAKDVYAQPALVPATPWLDKVPPSRPQLSVVPASPTGLRLAWIPTGTEPVRLWVLQIRSEGTWQTEILPGRQMSKQLPPQIFPESIALTGVDQCGNTSRPMVLQRK